MLRLYLIGVCILLIAIIVNIIVGHLGISNWYSFGPNFFSKGFIAIKEAGYINCIWLFILYPLTLSLGYIIGDKIYNFIF